MKRLKIILLLLSLQVSFIGFAQSTGPSDPGNDPTGEEPPLGGGAPIGSGTLLLLGLGAFYGSIKYKELRTEKESEQ